MNAQELISATVPFEDGNAIPQDAQQIVNSVSDQAASCEDDLNLITAFEARSTFGNCTNNAQPFGDVSALDHADPKITGDLGNIHLPLTDAVGS